MGKKYSSGQACMKFIHILVEGFTEETFVRGVLNPYFSQKSIRLTPIVVSTKRIKSGRKFKGGVSNYRKIKKDVMRLLHDSSVIAVTTMFDFYGIPDDFPGKTSMSNDEGKKNVKYLERSFSQDINNSKFIPFLTLHEFETFVFTSPEEFDKVFPGCKISSKIEDIKRVFRTPEDIDEGVTTHPFARIKDIIPSYQKQLHGSLITKRTGIAKIIRECPHFAEWMDKIGNFNA